MPSSGSVLALAARLRSLDDEALARLVSARGIREHGIRDFFDLAEALLDPDDTIRLDANELNDSRTLEPNGNAARRWFRDFTMLLQSLFALLATV